MRKTFDDKISEAKSLLDVLLILKEKTMLDTHVATLVYLNRVVSTFNGKYGIWECRPFPLNEKQEEYRIQAYYFSQDGDSFITDSLALVVFTDRNFINNLQTSGAFVKQTTDETTHSLKFGVIVSLPGLSLSPEEKKNILDLDVDFK